ncbi:EAL domain-containing protein [Arthrobacter sp. NyZ413]|uniref:EAL domain-containing protein n=1 Tax=Arthrobacter sp. NyZ413 TaxID=3144669 RepID=UPI003BF816EF
MKTLINVFAGLGSPFFRHRRRAVSGKLRGVRGGKGAGPERAHSVRGRVSPALLGQGLDAVSEASLITDAEQCIVYANPAFTAVTGYSSEEVLGRNCRLLQGPGSDSRTIAALRTTLARQETFRGEILNYRKDGTPFWNALTVSPLRDRTGAVTHFVSVQRDVTAQKALQDRLRFLALHDPVTGLPNRTALDRHLSARRADNTVRAGHVAVGIIALDDTRPANDVDRHETGDALLLEFAHRMRAKLRDTDFLARLGGDEFVLVIEDLDRETPEVQLGSILARLHQAVDTEFVPAPGTGVRMGMSLGIALWTPATETGEEILRRADAVLCELTSRTDDRDPWWQLEDTDAAALTGSNTAPLRSTGPKESQDGAKQPAPAGPAPRNGIFTGGLRMYFQPVVDLDTGKIHLLEALARLHLTDGTVQVPSAFLPGLSEEDTNRLFRDSLDQTLGHLAAWDSAGHRLRASINLHPSTLLDPDCAHWVASALDHHHLTPDRLVIELLENHAEDSEAQQRTFNDLHALGVGMAQDDLGAGHSSLRRLTAMAFDTVKIDHRVIAQLNTSPIPTMTFLTTMIRMGQDMGWRVIAEGLEDHGLTEAVIILGIPYGQGYHIARPMPAEQVPAWIADFQPPSRPGPVRTVLGALAFHWQYARLDSPHPGPVETCSLTSFLSKAIHGEDATKWHQQQHAPARDHTPAGIELLQWLTDRLTKDRPGKPLTTTT